MMPTAVGAARTTGPAPSDDTHERIYPGRPDQVREARRFLARMLESGPLADDAVLCVSELATNCVAHSASSRPGNTFTVRAQVGDGDRVWLAVIDAGGPWGPPATDGREHGLDIVGRLASEWGIAGGPDTGWVVWARLDDQARRRPQVT